MFSLKKRAWLGLVVALFGACTLFAVFRNYHTVALMDQWDTLDFYAKHLAGTLTFHDFWAQHNEHRILFPRILILADYVLEGGAGYYLVALILLLQAAHAVVLARASSKIGGTGDGERFLFAGLAFLLCFWLKQRENFVWSFQIAWMLNGLAVSLASYGAAGLDFRASSLSSWKRIFFLALCCVVATYSLASGILLAGVLGLMLWKAGARRSTLALWTLFCAGLAVSYLAGYHSPAHIPSQGIFNLQTPAYFLGYLGGPVLLKSPATFIGILVGMAVLSGFLLLTFRFLREERPSFYTRFSFGVASYVMLGALLTTSGRHALGVMQAASSRYTTPVVVLWFILLTWGYGISTGGRKPVLKACIGLLVLYVLSTQWVIVGRMKVSGVVLDDASLAMMANVGDSVAWHRVYPFEEKLWGRNAFMREHHLFQYRDSWTRRQGHSFSQTWSLDEAKAAPAGVWEERRPGESLLRPGYYLRLRLDAADPAGLIAFVRHDTVVGFARKDGRPCAGCYSGYAAGGVDSVQAYLLSSGKLSDRARKVLLR